MVRSTRDQGQAAVFMVLVSVALFALVLTALLSFGGQITGRTRAQSAADAAALAAVAGGVDAASEFAQLHGATLVSFVADGEVVTVVVRLGESTASASATNAP